MAFTVWLSPKLGAFLNAHPDIGVKLVTSMWEGPSDQQPVDIDIVLAPSNHAEPNLERLADEAIVPLCALDAGDDITTPRGLLRQDPIHVMGYEDHWARYLAAYALAPDLSATRLMTDTSVAATEMAAAGLGCAMVIERFAEQAIASGRSVRIVGDAVELGQSHFLLRSRQQSARKFGVEAFRTWLQAQF